MNRRHTILLDKTNLFYYLSFVPLFLSFSFPCDHGARAQGFSDLFYNFEALDPEVFKLLTFRNKAYAKTADSGELDILDLDTSDILNCFTSLSYMCFQKKIIVYLDSLNRASKINLFGGYMSFVKVGPPPELPMPITEQLLSREIHNETDLGNVLRELFDNFVDTHVLRITVPVLNAKLEARSSSGHCYDFSLTDVAKLASNNDTRAETPDNSKAPSCYRGDQSMVALSSALVFKLITLFPTLLKVIAAKAIFGILMGAISVILSKMAILPLVLSYANKNVNQPHSNVAPISGSFRQGVSPTSSPPLTLTTDNYETYHPREEPSTRVIVNNLERPDYGPSARHIATWSEAKSHAKNPSDYQLSRTFSHASVTPRKERVPANRPMSTTKSKVPTYPEMVINNRHVESVTITGPTTTNVVEKTDIRNNIESSITPVGATATHAYLTDNGFPLFEHTI